MDSLSLTSGFAAPVGQVRLSLTAADPSSGTLLPTTSQSVAPVKPASEGQASTSSTDGHGASPDPRGHQSGSDNWLVARYERDQDTGTMVFTLIDDRTKEVIGQIPDESAVKFRAYQSQLLWQKQLGEETRPAETQARLT